jgi:hypothetical protein
MEATSIWQAKKRMSAMLAVILLLGSVGFAAAAEDSVSHVVRIQILPVSMLDVDSEWHVQTQQENQNGGRTVELVANYGVSCNVPGSVIWADFSSSIPEGVRVAVRMESTVGTSTGWHDLSGCTSVELVRQPRGAEYNYVLVRVEMDEQVNPCSVQMGFAFRLEESREEL